LRPKCNIFCIIADCIPLQMTPVVRGSQTLYWNSWRRINLSWNTAEDKGTTMQPTWRAKIMAYKTEFYSKFHWHLYVIRTAWSECCAMWCDEIICQIRHFLWCFRETAASVNHWKILTDHVKSFTSKQLRDKPQEAKTASVKALRHRTVDVHDALTTLADREERHDPNTAHEAVSLPVTVERC
jgi:hypothetical protein